MNTTEEERVPDAIRRLREGKRQLRHSRMAMSLPDKVRQVVHLQEINLRLIQRRRPLGPLERAWPLRDKR
jgi:hypothetical protein